MIVESEWIRNIFIKKYNIKSAIVFNLYLFQEKHKDFIIDLIGDFKNIIFSIFISMCFFNNDYKILFRKSKR